MARNTGLTFSAALTLLKEGHALKRDGWNGRGMQIVLVQSQPKAACTLPYLMMSTVQGDTVPWLASHTDLLAEDWVVLS